MRLTTFEDGTADGSLAVISADGERYLPAGKCLLAAIEDWAATAPMLCALEQELANGQGQSLAALSLLAPLPRAWQWLDASAFTSHGDLMQIAFGLDPVESDRPLMYQGISDRFLAPGADVPLPDEADGIDFEGEFAIVTDFVPMGTSAADALAHIKLVLQLNDWSLRVPGAAEMRTGFGWIQAKPACSVAPFAVTPDELGNDWRDGRVCLELTVDFRGARFGAARGDEMAFGFHELIAHAARTRHLVAGTIIGSGTVSNSNYREIGSSCIAERRAIEIVDTGAPATEFMRFGEMIRMEGRNMDGRAPFGAIEQRVVRA